MWRSKPHHARLTAQNALDLIGGYDWSPTARTISTPAIWCPMPVISRTKPLVTARARLFDGTLTTIRAHERGADGKPNPTYRCLFPEPPPPGTVPACAEAGILGALAGVIGSMAALEVIREIVGFGEGLVGRLVMLDARAMRFETLRYAWDPKIHCPVNIRPSRICRATFEAGNLPAHRDLPTIFLTTAA